MERASLDRMIRDGTVRRLLRGVYVAACAPDLPGLRVAATRLAVRRDVVVVDRTAAWIHGVSLAGPDGVHPLDTLAVGRPARGSTAAAFG